MTLRYICDRCDLRAESSVGHHVCEAQSDESLSRALIKANVRGDCESSIEEVFEFLVPRVLSLGYRWSLSSVGDGTEYRATFEHGLGNTIASVLDATPARAFARGFLRIPKESEG